MCGIFGWVGLPPARAEDISGRLLRLLQHRGPDDSGFETGDGWGLGFRRLSILDLSPLGHQPMRTEDGRFWLVFNGEIYNYRELRQRLEQQGERFKSGSDTEVLLRMLMLEGAAALQSLNGMFGFAFIDTERRTFLLARDRLGVKPLYYTLQHQQVRFASELKALLAWPDASHTIDHAALAEYLAINFVPGESCIFEGYRKLPPGHYLAGSLDAPEQAEPCRYWHLDIDAPDGPDALSTHQLDDLLNLLENAVSLRLRSDVPVGIFLSGGLDSGLVTALAGRASDSSAPLALTAGFDDEAFDETALAQMTARHAGIEHRVIRHQAASVRQIDRLAWFYDEPFGDASALPMFNLCEAVAPHAKVILTGDGGDETFAGYRRYVKTLRYRRLGDLPRPAQVAMQWVAQTLPTYSALRYRLVKSALPDEGFAAAFDDTPEDPAVAAILSDGLRQSVNGLGRPVWGRWQTSAGRDVTTRQQLLDYSLYLPDDILVKADRASMANSVELRSPFLDYRLVEWGSRLPRAALLDSTEGKKPLRQLASRLLPAEVQTGVKRHFGIPFGTWLRSPEANAFARERLVSSEARALGFWNPEAVDQVLVEHQSGKRRDLGFLVWRLLMLDAWARHYADGTAFLQGPPVS
jgi:asparagine synthase (glutamine-hydrolysing)